MFSEASSSSVYVGTHGYMALECRYGVGSSLKQDVFSFGVVLLKLLTGKVAVMDEEEGGGERKSLAEWAAIMRNNEGQAIKDLVDPNLVNDFIKCGDEIEIVFEISLLCTRPSSKERTSIRSIVDKLSSSYPLIVATK